MGLSDEETRLDFSDALLSEVNALLYRQVGLVVAIKDAQHKVGCIAMGAKRHLPKI